NLFSQLAQQQLSFEQRPTRVLSPWIRHC
ncbi:unnamed protein product, partial [Allacma fusca]